MEWTTVKEIYFNLVKNIAHEYYPKAEQPIYEAKLSELLTCGVHFFEKIAAIQNYPFFNKVLDLRIKHALMARDTTGFLVNNQILSLEIE